MKTHSLLPSVSKGCIFLALYALSGACKLITLGIPVPISRLSFSLATSSSLRVSLEGVQEVCCVGAAVGSRTDAA